MTIIRPKASNIFILLCLSGLIGSQCFVQNQVARGAPFHPTSTKIRTKIRTPPGIMLTPLPCQHRICHLYASVTSADDDCHPSSSSPIFQYAADFVYGFRHVHTDYLRIFSQYSLQKTFRILLPVFGLLATSDFLFPDLGSFLYKSIDQVLWAIFWLSTTVGEILLLPLTLLVRICHTLPTIVVPILDYMPRTVVVNFVAPVLYIYRKFSILTKSPLFGYLAVLLWRPTIEEFQYRFLMNKISLGPPGKPEESQHTEQEQKLSQRFLLSSFLFAATRLGWSCARPDDVLTPSPYAWTVGFCQSVLAHVFSSRALSELRPLLQRALIFLALHQAISTYFISIKIYVPFYKERGLCASIGAHLAWTIGKLTLPFRLSKRLYLMIRRQIEGFGTENNLSLEAAEDGS